MRTIGEYTDEELVLKYVDAVRALKEAQTAVERSREGLAHRLGMSGSKVIRVNGINWLVEAEGHGFRVGFGLP